MQVFFDTWWGNLKTVHNIRDNVSTDYQLSANAADHQTNWLATTAAKASVKCKYTAVQAKH